MNAWQRNKTRAFLLCLVMGLMACGQGQLTETQETNVALKVGDSISIASGDQLVPANDATVIDITYKVESEIKVVTLVSGAAILIRGSEVN